MKKLGIRQGMIGGSVVALIGAAGAVGRSPDPLPTFASVLAFTLACVAAVVGMAVLANRPSKPPARW